LGARAGLIFPPRGGGRPGPIPAGYHRVMGSTVDPSPDTRRGENFLLATCQGGAEATLAERVARLLPGTRRGAWRRGLVTFRLPPTVSLPDDPLSGTLSDAIFARTACHCLGQVTGDDDRTRVAALLALLPVADYRHLHVWPRDPAGCAGPADHADGSRATRAVIAAAFPGLRATDAVTGEFVIDVVIDGPDRWWVGWHRVATASSALPGGIHPRSLPSEAVSRAWLKLDEALASFAIAIGPGERAVELGAAPGGASQRLLDAGLDVVGIDPALVDPVVASHPRFTHWRKRARDVRLRDFRGFDWIVADMNIDPTSTLEAIGRVVTAPGVRPRGIVATLKLPDWSRAAALDGWLAEIRAWGYLPRARQLSTAGREVCVVALGRARRTPAATAPRPRRPRGGRALTPSPPRSRPRRDR